MPTDLRHITDFDELLIYLGDELEWPVEDYPLEQLTFEYDADELGLNDEEARKVRDGSIRQLRPLPGGQPFGIFFVEFAQAKLPVVVLRRILNALVVKKRNSANPADRQRWDAADILFISAFGENEEREIAFAHFHKDPDTTELPILRVLGWDGADTTLKTQYVARVLKARLHWPDNPADQKSWRKEWRSAFRHRQGHVISTASELADALATFARKIRDAAITVMAHESDTRGQVRKLHRAFKASLIHDLTEADFADTYAQTITYGLLTAAISKTEMTEGRHGTALTQEDITAMVPVTNPFLKEMLEEFLKVGGRGSGVDFDELGISDVVELLRDDETDLPAVMRDFGKRQPGEDPVIHFYETFLKAYNKELRVKRGVFYTPQPVVSYIVRSVHELLQTEFGLEHGLADTTTWAEFIQKSLIQNPTSKISLPPLTDLPGEKQTISPDEPFVQILDPATGTATFLVEVIDEIHKHLKERWRPADRQNLPGYRPELKSFEDYWNHYVPKHLLPRLHAYELMMAPYAIAHMKIGLKLAETGYTFATEERARIYLTNALEPWQQQLTLPDFEALAHEAQAVNEIKRHKRFTVIIGNPPYAGISSNKSEAMLRIVDAYRIVDGAALTERKLWLQDDYVKFIRKAQSVIEITRIGVLGYITNHGYLDNPTFRGMRQSLMRTFPQLRVIDLHGNSKRTPCNPDGLPDANVFDIQQGVSLALFSTQTLGPANAQVSHSELWGSRERKYNFLDTHTSKSTKWEKLHPMPEFYLLVPHDIESKGEYEEGWKIADVFPLNGTGVVTGRDSMTIDFDREQLWNRLTEFAKSSEASARANYELGKDARDWRVATAQADVIASGPTESKLMPILYRPFDFRFTYYTGNSRGFYASPCSKVMQNMAGGKNMGFVWSRPMSPQFEFTVCVSRTVTDQCSVGNKSAGAGISYLAPLRAYHGDSPEQTGFGLAATTYPNFGQPFLKQLSSRLNLSRSGLDGLPSSLTPEDIFHYAYAVFHSPGYRSRYAEFLKIDFPRLPLTGNLELFRELSRLGGELTALHLLESSKLDQPITNFIGDNHQISRVGWTPDGGGTVWIDGTGTKANFKAGTSGFSSVPEPVWNFHIGGYQVCDKWLKDRGPKKGKPGRTLSPEDIAHYHKIVIALSETIRLMAEIDEVIESHGGWPGAFQTGVKEEKA